MPKQHALESSESSENTAYRIFFFLGLGNLFPWNTFITASYYFAARFCGTNFEETFENYFTLSFTIAQTVGLALTIRYCEKWSLQRKVIYPLGVYSLIFLMTTVLVVILGIDPTRFSLSPYSVQPSQGCVGVSSPQAYSVWPLSSRNDILVH